MANSPRFWNFIARRYARSKVADEAAYREKLSRTQAILKPDWHVLEFGCGTGSTALEHAPHVAHIRGIDISAKMIEICEEKRSAAGIENITFEVADIDAVDLPEGGYDAVLGMSILHLLENRDEIIAKVFEILRPGGYFFSSTLVVDSSAGFFLRYILPVGAAIGVLPRVWSFPAAELVTAMERAGFVIEDRFEPGADDDMRAIFLVARKPAASQDQPVET